MTLKTYSVYIHTTPNEKRYIGITTQKPEDRWAKGCGYSHNTYFNRAIKKYGWNNIIHEVLISDLSENDAIKLEIELIKKYKTMNQKYGYNLTSGGEKAKVYSEISKKKMSDNLKGVNAGDKHRCYGMKPEEIWGQEAFQKNIELSRVRWSGENNPQKLNPRIGENHPNFGRKFSEEVKFKMRNNKKNKKLSDEDALNILCEYYESNITQNKIADRYSISRQTVGDIVNRRIYNHIEFKYNHETRLEKSKIERIKKISKPIGKLDINGDVVIKAVSIKQMSEFTEWSSTGILKHLKNRVKNPIFIYL